MGFACLKCLYFLRFYLNELSRKALCKNNYQLPYFRVIFYLYPYILVFSR
ncbi:hypothetical protein Leryth_011754 [Lithospermum erythrorhizon]|nr:hypothetical protein Leryth_011754 [Lithospermum erythrorhizon]